MWRAQLLIVFLFACVGSLAAFQRDGSLSAFGSFQEWGAGGASEGGPETASQARRRQILEFLDTWVLHQRHHRAVYGHYSDSFPKVKLEVPESLRASVDLRVLEANADRFLASAVFVAQEGSAERGGEPRRERVSVDQDFRVRANFRLPEPRADYLKEAALRHLRLLSQQPSHLPLEERSVFRGWFRYVRSGALPRAARGADVPRRFIATGVKAPVLGLKLEVKAPSSTQAGPVGGLQNWLVEGAVFGVSGVFGAPGVGEFGVNPAGPPSLGRGAVSPPMNPWVGEIAFAQRLFQAKFGRQPKSVEELMGLVRLDGIVSTLQARLPAAFESRASGSGGRSAKKSGSALRTRSEVRGAAVVVPPPTSKDLEETPLEVEPVTSFEDG